MSIEKSKSESRLLVTLLFLSESKNNTPMGKNHTKNAWPLATVMFWLDLEIFFCWWQKKEDSLFFFPYIFAGFHIWWIKKKRTKTKILITWDYSTNVLVELYRSMKKCLLNNNIDLYCLIWSSKWRKERYTDMCNIHKDHNTLT